MKGQFSGGLYVLDSESYSSNLQTDRGLVVSQAQPRFKVHSSGNLVVLIELEGFWWRAHGINVCVCSMCFCVWDNMHLFLNRHCMQKDWLCDKPQI